MAAGLVHEINQPLASIINYARGAIRRIDSANPPSLEGLRDSLERIAQQAYHAEEISNRMRNLIKGDFPKLPIDINALIIDKVEDCTPEAQAQNLLIHSELDLKLPPVLGDGVQIGQVLLNLLGNAIEASSQADQHTQRVITVCSTVRDGEVIVQVGDRGPGLSPETAERIFDWFYTTKPRGLGVGLAISRFIIQAHGGKLWAQVSPHGGTLLSFTLPIIESTNQEEACP